MKRALLCLVLVVVFVMAFASIAYAAGAMWNFERDHAVTNGPVLVTSPLSVTPTNPTGIVWDSRGRTGRIYEWVHYANAYQRGAAGSGNIYANTEPVYGGIIAAGYPHAGEIYLKMAAVGAPGSTGVTGPGRYVYLAWWAVDPADPNHVVDTANTGVSPHGGYTTTSIKCAVCHVVHAAAPGRDDAGVAVADTLLRFKASDSCGYCHVAAGSTVVSPVYGGVWPVPAEAGHALATPACSECHASVHGANAEEIPSLKGLLLKTKVGEELASRAFEGLDYDTSVVERVAAIEASAAAQGFGADPKVTGYNVADYESEAVFAADGMKVRNQAVGVFCGGCHIGSYASAVAGARGGTESGGLLGTSPYAGHRTLASATTTWNADGLMSSGARGIGNIGFKIAEKAAMDCYGCHDSYNGFGVGQHAFPHNWGTAGDELLERDPVTGTFENQSMTWLLAAPDAETEPVVNGGAIGKAGHAGPLGGTLSDGVCLKCHRWAEGGVGVTY